MLFYLRSTSMPLAVDAQLALAMSRASTRNSQPIRADPPSF